eukprot:Rmarinus@m.21560
MEHAVENVLMGSRNVLTEVSRFHLNRGSTLKDLVLVFFPGNPGMIGFYNPFFKHLANRAPKEIQQIVGVGFAGHDSGLNSGSLFNLHEQIDHKVCFLEQERERQRARGIEPKFVIVGHSIGSHVALEVVKRCDHLSIPRTYLLMPAIRNVGTQAGHHRSLLVSWGVRHVVAGFVDVMSWLPTYVKVYLARLSVPDAHVPAALHYFNKHAWLNVMHLANHEFQVVQEIDHSELRPLLPRLTFYYGKEDEWAPEHHHDDLREAYGKSGELSLHLDPSDHQMKHAFCMTDKDSEFMARELTRLLESELGLERGA